MLLCVAIEARCLMLAKSFLPESNMPGSLLENSASKYSWQGGMQYALLHT